MRWACDTTVATNPRSEHSGNRTAPKKLDTPGLNGEQRAWTGSRVARLRSFRASRLVSRASLVSALLAGWRAPRHKAWPISSIRSRGPRCRRVKKSLHEDTPMPPMRPAPVATVIIFVCGAGERARVISRRRIVAAEEPAGKPAAAAWVYNSIRECGYGAHGHCSCQPTGNPYPSKRSHTDFSFESRGSRPMRRGPWHVLGTLARARRRSRRVRLEND